MVAEAPLVLVGRPWTLLATIGLWVCLGVATLSGGLAAVLAVASVPFAFPALGVAVGALTATALSAGLASTPWRATVDGSGVRLGRLGLRRIPASAVRDLVLEGRPGHPVRLRVNGVVVAEDTDSSLHGRELFDLERWRSLAHEVGARLGVPPEDRTAPDAVWEAHRHASLLARQAQVDALRSDCERRYPWVRTLVPVEPDATWTPTGVRAVLPGAGTVTIDADTLAGPSFTTSLGWIEQAFVFVEHDGLSTWASLRIEYDGDTWTVLRVRIHEPDQIPVRGVPVQACQLLWLASTIERLAVQAREREQARGDDAAVPHALRALTRRQQEG